MQIDNLDKQILGILKKDSRCPFVDIAERIGVSEGTVRSRVHKMSSEGVIKGFTIRTGSRNAKALVEVRIDVNADTSEVAGRMLAFPEVKEVFEVTGDQDIILIVDADSTQRLNEILDTIRRHDSILNTYTHFILKEHFGSA
ncbi:MAG: Lrp/AsnC family transcriptional regulator [Thermoplasmatales archaeon]|nr:Lrp/AsnC family transcriptional regulator [Thermoplasmatales archaeon]